MTEHTTSPGTPGTPTITTGTPGAASRSGGGGPGLFARCVAETAGSFLVIVVGIGATMLATEAALQPGLVLGFAVVAAMIAFGHVSGGHFNPAVTLGSAVAGRTEWKAVLPYVVAQVLGAAAAAGLLWLVLSSNAQLTGIDAFFGSASNGFDEHSPAGFPLTSAFLIEVVAAALLVAVFLGAGARCAVRGLAPFAVGLTYAGLVSFLLPITNGGINPIRSAATALFAESWALEQLWLFWAAPLLGGVLAGLVYRSVDWASDARTDGSRTADSATDGSGTDGSGTVGTDGTMTTDPAAPGSANRGTPRVLGTGRGRADRLAADDEGDGEDSAAPRH